MYNAVLDFFPKHYTKLREITTGTGQGYVFILSVIAEPVPVALLDTHYLTEWPSGLSP